MVNGRPAENSFMTEFYPYETQGFVFSLKNKIDVSGKQFVTSQVNKEGEFHGQAKGWNKNGEIFVGSLNLAYKKNGARYKL